MRKTKPILLICILSFLAFSALVFINANAITAKTIVIKASVLDDVQVDYVDHFVKILEGGTVVINDTLRLSAKPGQTVTLTEYSLGFPYKYKYRLAYCFAFNASNPSQAFNIILDTGLGEIGYYGVTVVFPEGGVQLTDSQSFSFTTVFVFSNIIISSTYTYPSEEQLGKNVTEPVLTLDYPAYPSLPQNASSVNVTIVCPPKAPFVDGNPSTFSIGGNLEKGQILSLTKSPLEKLTNFIGWMNFTSQDNTYRVVTIDALERRIEIDGWGNIFVTEDYTVTSQMQQQLTGMRIRLLEGANNVSAWNLQGKAITAALADKNTTTYSVDFGLALNRGNSTKFKLTYYLPGTYYLTETTPGDFNLNFPTTKNLNRVARKLTTSITFPEGASLKQSTLPGTGDYVLQKGALSEKILFTAYNVSLYNNMNLTMEYSYSLLWASYRPTLWMTALVAIGCVVALIWKAPRAAVPAPLPGVGVKTHVLRDIVSFYEERKRILRELDSLDNQMQKGRLPRARYKARRRMLESQLSRLNRDMVDLKQKVKSASPKYADIVKDLEVAEAELQGVEAEARRVTAQYRRGEISLETYKRLQDQYNKRREKAKTIMDGALLRLSEGAT